MNALLKLLIVSLLLSLAGCTGSKIRKEKPADVIFTEGMALFERKSYEDAGASFQELNAKYPLSQYAVQAKLKIADSYFYDESYPEAISAYREFEKLHPTNDNIPYVIFQIGMSYFNQILTIDRDQTATKNAAAEFTRFISRFPNNQYADDAGKNLAICRNNMAENVFYIGNFYYKKGKYKAAIERFEVIIKAYPDFRGMDKVLFLIGKAHIELKETEKGNAYLEKLLKDYPESKFVKEARGILGVN
ncbi:MAG: outer membrane protein assembly factor BamD [Deltaproteobacteria bacterium]|nr:outer membrane protein assembly factor BamD [Deltaproteobacteria bacterium]